MRIVNQNEALSIIKNGSAIGFPTDTLPAIGCLPEYSETIYSIKQREKNKALILMGANISQIYDYVHDSAKKDFLTLAEKYWPGPLTMVIPLSNDYKLKFSKNNKTLGIRVPNSPVAKSLLSITGPLATSSANISGLKTSFTAEEVAFDLPSLDLLEPIPWPECSGEASTIVSWIRKKEWKLLRQGGISICNNC